MDAWPLAQSRLTVSFIVPFGSFSFPPEWEREASPLRSQALQARQAAWRVKVEQDHQAWSALLSDDAKMGAALCANGWSPFAAGCVAPPAAASMNLSARLATALSAASAWTNADDLHALCVVCGSANFWESLTQRIPALALVPADHGAVWDRALKHAPAQSLRKLAELFTLPPLADAGAWLAFSRRDDAPEAFDALAESFSPDALWHMDRDRPRSILTALNSALRTRPSDPIFWAASTEPLLERVLHWGREKPLTAKTPKETISFVYHRSLSQFLAFSAVDASSPPAREAREMAVRIVESCLARHPEEIAGFERDNRANALASLRMEERLGRDGKERRPLQAWMALGNRLRHEASDAKSGLSLWEIAVIDDNPRWMDFAERAAGPWSWGGPWTEIEVPNPYWLLRQRDETRKRSSARPMEKAFASARKAIAAAPLPSAKQRELLSVLDLSALPDSRPPEADSNAATLSFQRSLPEDLESILWKAVATPKPNLCAWLAEKSRDNPTFSHERWAAARHLDQIDSSRLPPFPKLTDEFYETVAEHAEIHADLAQYSASKKAPSDASPAAASVKGSCRI